MLTPEQFLRDVSRHKLEVLREDGLYRHLRFKRPGDGCMHFDLLTWPGSLCFTGDMGTFVFSRLPDMLQFFRRRANREPFRMDLRYWAEKCQAQCARGSGVAEFDPARFQREVTEQRRAMLVRHGRAMDEGDRRDLWDSLGDVLSAADEGEWRAYAAADVFSFSWTDGRGGLQRIGLQLSEFPDCKTYTHTFVWCCYALEWAIDQFDAARVAGEQPRLSAEG